MYVILSLFKLSDVQGLEIIKSNAFITTFLDLYLLFNQHFAKKEKMFHPHKQTVLLSCTSKTLLSPVDDVFQVFISNQSLFIYCLSYISLWDQESYKL